MKRNISKVFFFQDVEMREAFKAYPEIIFIDATYKLLELGLPVYLMLYEDSNGQSEIYSKDVAVRRAAKHSVVAAKERTKNVLKAASAETV